MDYGYQDRLDLENDLYQDDNGDLEGSEVDSELEFHLYGQLHYSSQPGETEEQDDGEKECQENSQHEAIQRTLDQNGEPEGLGESECPSHANGLLQQHLKKKGEKQEKQKKRKSDPKGQKSSSTFFEKVIVIDSSPDVISISEDSAEELDGICSLKGNFIRKSQTSTPARQDYLTQESSRHALVIVDSSSSELESEESECETEPDSSDSDALENWMILGRGNQDGDQSISLNLEGGHDRDTDANSQDESSWLVSDKDREAQIYNSDRGSSKVAARRLSNRYYTDKKVHCRNCDKTGHLSKNCPEPKKVSPCYLCGTPGHISSECPNRHCNNCGLPGHVFNSCTERAYWHKQCHRCNKTGHFFDACPEVWRQYHITTKIGPPVKPPGTCNGRSPAYCYNCSKKGHFGHACTRQRMFNGVYPNTPFINTYDTVREINSRRHRMRLKVKELKENGFFSSLPNTPLTPGPPRKKRKVSNNHTPRQAPSNHKPSSSHIFFDNDDTAAKPKKYKHKQEDIFRSAKPWKPKRPVPTSRNPPPSKLVLDEADDFPRGGGTGASLKRTRKRGPNRNKNKTWKNESGKKRRSNEYPADENLFIIKQRKRRR